MDVHGILVIIFCVIFFGCAQAPVKTAAPAATRKPASIVDFDSEADYLDDVAGEKAEQKKKGSSKP